MADSPEKDSEGVIRLTLFSEGNQLADSLQVVSVEVNKAVNTIPSARIIVLDGDMPGKEFPVSDDSDFAPGSAIKINAGYKDDEETIFEGIVIKHSLKISGDNYSRLHIECRDKAVAMTVGRKNANFVDSKDSDIFSKLVGNYSGLSVTADATSTEYGELVQYYCSDWDFMLSRAEVNGALVIVDDASVSVGAPDTSSSAVLSVTYGQDLMEFHGDIDARSQYSEVKTVSWDPAQQAISEQSVATQTLNSQGNLTSSKLAEVIGLDSYKLQTPAKLDSAALKDWATGQQVKSGLARVTGRMKFQGSAKAKPGTLISLEGVGDRFSGDVFVSSVTHLIEDGDWVTEAEFGLSPEWFIEKHDVTAPTAAGLLPGVDGLQIGVVMQLDEDPDGENRIKVKVPVLETETTGVWARLANYYASDGFGEFFIPEIGDEVLLGYLNNDPGHPVILGSLYSSKLAPPYALTAENNTKAIVTRSKLTVEFDDDKKVITVVTPGGNKMVLSDDEESITLLDQNSNKMTMDSGGITLDSPSDITITAGGKMTLTSTSDMSLSSSANLTGSGLNVEHSADVGLTAKGGASAELSAGGNTTVKGAMVMIN